MREVGQQRTGARGEGSAANHRKVAAVVRLPQRPLVRDLAAGCVLRRRHHSVSFVIRASA